MWIRSQDGMELIKADCIKIDFNPSLWARIYAHSNDRSRLMGEYDTEAEALRVLDRLQRQHDMDVYEHGPEGMRVFQMPEKWFSKAAGE